MATTDIYDDMARLQLKMMKQRLANERDRQDHHSRPSSTTSQDSNNSLKLHRAVLRRQELLDKIKQEQRANDDLRRPQSFNGRRRSPMPPPSRMSLPEFRDREHQFRPMAQAYHLPPIQNVAPPPPPQPAPPVYIQAMQPEQPKSTWNKGDFMEMMMMQNAQMHQMVMQQMMLSSMPVAFKPPMQQQQQQPPMIIQDSQMLPSEGRRPTSVHHHHYGPGGSNSLPAAYPPQPAPIVHHYTPLPPLNVRAAPYPYGRSQWYPSEVEPLKQPRDYDSYLQQYYEQPGHGY